MVGTNARFVLRYDAKIFPSERSLVNIEAPDVVNGLRACVTAEDKQVRLAEDDTVTVAATGCATHNGHDHPLRGGITVPQIQQVKIVRGQATTCKKTPRRR